MLQALKDLNINISPEEVSDMIAKCDEDGDGQINHAEFVNFLSVSN